MCQKSGVENFYDKLIMGSDNGLLPQLGFKRVKFQIMHGSTD